jgi:hypothetical protein
VNLAARRDDLLAIGREIVNSYVMSSTTEKRCAGEVKIRSARANRFPGSLPNDSILMSVKEARAAQD